MYVKNNFIFLKIKNYLLNFKGQIQIISNEYQNLL